MHEFVPVSMGVERSLGTAPRNPLNVAQYTLLRILPPLECLSLARSQEIKKLHVKCSFFNLRVYKDCINSER